MLAGLADVRHGDHVVPAIQWVAIDWSLKVFSARISVHPALLMTRVWPQEFREHNVIDNS
jgi:hypothetical protein